MHILPTVQFGNAASLDGEPSGSQLPREPFPLLAQLAWLDTACWAAV